MHWLLLTLLSLPALATMPPGDPVKDIITPYPGSWVLQSRNSLYEKFSYPLDAETSDFRRQRKLKELEGDVRRTFYRLPPASGELEAYRNYRDATTKADFTVTYDATGKQIGFAGGLARFLGMPCYDPPADQTHLLAAEKTINGVPVHLVVLTAACNNEGTRVGVWLVEEKPVRTNQVRINADELAKRLEEAGAVSIYGIEFDFDKADIKPVSEPVLQEIEKLLKRKTDLSLYVVGHTDMDGSLDYNMDLSEKRAAAVVRWLVQHQIAQTRLAPKGLGPLAPKSTNRSDAGRALNRRVELVERRR